MRFVHIADDTRVIESYSDINNIHATVNRGLVGVDNWLKAIRLSLNVSKTLYNDNQQTEKCSRHYNSIFNPDESFNSQILLRYT